MNFLQEKKINSKKKTLRNIQLHRVQLAKPVTENLNGDGQYKTKAN